MKFFDFFPAPSYFKIPAVGLDICDKSLKYVELKRKKKDIRLAAFGRKSIPAGIIETGQIKKPDEFVKLLKDFRKELKNDYLIVSLPEEKVFIGSLELPLMKEEEIRGSLELQLEEHIPLSAKEVMFDYEASEDISQQTKEGHLDVSFTAVPSISAGAYRDALKAAGFIPLVFEAEPHALARALIRPEEREVKMIIDFGQTRTSFVIALGPKIEMSSTAKVAGENLDLALAGAFSITPEEAGHLKEEKGLEKGGENEKFFSAILPVISAIRDETEKLLTYWKTHANEQNVPKREIEKIILCGGDANLKGLPEYLSRELHLLTELGNPWINVTAFEDYIPEIEFRESLMYATAIGLALRAV